MRIGIYNPRVGVAASGGTETFLREMLKRICPEHDVILYTGCGELLNEVKRLNIDIRQYPFIKKETRINELLTNRTPLIPAEVESISMYYHARRQKAFQKMEQDLDVISTHYYLDNILLSRKLSNVPTVFRFPGIKHSSVRWRLMAGMAKTDTYLANSNSTQSRAKKWLDIDVDDVVYAGVDTEQFSLDTDPAFEADSQVILFVGRLDTGKGLEDLLEAFNKIEEDCLLYLVGEGTLDSKLRSLAERLDISEDVVFTGAVPHSEIHRYYAAADIFCLPSYHEGFPVVNMEAMSSGLPIVSTTIDAVLEQIEDGKHGLLVEPGDIDELSNALASLLYDQELKDELGTRSRKRAETDFTWEINASRMINSYEKSSKINE